MVDWMVDRMVDWMVDWMVDRMVDWMVDRMVDWIVDWMVDWMVDRMAYLLIVDGVVDWLDDFADKLLHHVVGAAALVRVLPGRPPPAPPREGPEGVRGSGAHRRQPRPARRAHLSRLPPGGHLQPGPRQAAGKLYQTLLNPANL
eukprot:1010971-Prorocentrum_minimum.AAC.1